MKLKIFIALLVPLFIVAPNRVLSINWTEPIQLIAALENDSILPTASNPDPVTVQCLEQIPEPNISVVTDAEDNSGTVTIEWVSDASDGNSCPEVITRTYSVSDNSDNFITVSQTIIVDDITPPTASNPDSITVATREDVPPPDITVVTDETDNCSEPPLVAFVNDILDESATPLTLYRSYSVADLCKNTIYVLQKIYVEDNSYLTASNPAPITIECIEDLPQPDIAVVTDEADNCDGDIQVAFAADAWDGNSCSRIITRTYSLSNDCGKTNTVFQTIFVKDTTPPTATEPETLVVSSLEDVPEADVSVIKDIADNCTGSPYIEFEDEKWDDPESPSVITRTYTVTDDCGNFISLSHIIQIESPSQLTASNPEPILVDCIKDLPQPDIKVVTDEADGCEGNIQVAFVSDVSDGNTCPKTITRTYSVSNDCVETIYVSQTITIEDIIPPQIECPPSPTTEYSSAPDIYSAEMFLNAGGQLTDNCTVDYNLFNLLSEIETDNEIVRVYSLSDLCGNISTCNQIIKLKKSATSAKLIKNPVEYSLVPNPTSGLFILSFNSEVNNEVTLKLVNSTGQVLESRLLKCISPDHTEYFNISKYSAGIYYLNIYSNGLKKSEKIVLQ